MSVNPTSIQSGFARSRSEALFPRLFPDAGWWCPSLNPPGGTRLHDLSGRQNWGTLTSMANDDWVVSVGRGALDFDGSNDGVLTNSAPAITTNAVTVCTWLNPSRLTRGDLVTRWVGGASSGDQFNLLYGLTSGKPQFYVAFGPSGGTNSGTGSATMAIGRWHFVTGIWTGSACEVYLDGVFQSRSTTAGTLRTTAGSQFSIGRNLSTDGYTQGQLDDIRIYDRALSASEVRQLYQLGRGNMPRIRQRRYTEEAAGFKAYWANRRSRIIGAGI